MQLVTLAIIKRNEKFLIAKRKAGGVVGGKWEFPGGKIESNESPQEGLRRELKEELDANVAVGEFFDQHLHRYNNGRLKVMAYSVNCPNYKFKLSEHDEIRWITASEMLNYDFTGNGKPFIKKLAKHPNLSMEIGFLLQNTVLDCETGLGC